MSWWFWCEVCTMLAAVSTSLMHSMFSCQTKVKIKFASLQMLWFITAITPLHLLCSQQRRQCKTQVLIYEIYFPIWLLLIKKKVVMQILVPLCSAPIFNFCFYQTEWNLWNLWVLIIKRTVVLLCSSAPEIQGNSRWFWLRPILTGLQLCTSQ